MGNGSNATIGGNLKALLGFEGDGQTVNVGGGAIDQKDSDNVINTRLADGEGGDDFTGALLKQRGALMASLGDLSKNLAALDETGRGDVSGDSLRFKANDGLNVFRLALSDFDKIGEIGIDAADGSTTVINISGEAGKVSSKFADATAALGGKVIWNFYQARDLVFDAPFFRLGARSRANVLTNDVVNGTVVASSLSQTAAIHGESFQGDVSSVGASVSAMPEPATWTMLILGFGITGFAVRRRYIHRNLTNA